MISEEQYIEHTRRWVQDVVIGLNFCPFAAKPVKDGKVRYTVEQSLAISVCLDAVIGECKLLDDDPGIETTLIILPKGFTVFEHYLDLVDLAEERMRKAGYEGVYQLASFHPEYRFAGEPADDAANYTNRSPYPMLHVLREDSLEEAIYQHRDVEGIPERNIRFAREKGEEFLRLLRKACMD